MTRYGSAQMSTAELLILCFGSRLLDENVVLLSQRMLKEIGSVHALLAAPIQQLLAVRGMGPEKAARVKTIHELSVRGTEVQLKRTQSLNEPAAVVTFLPKRSGIWVTRRSGVYFLMLSRNIVSSKFCFENPSTAPMCAPAKC